MDKPVLRPIYVGHRCGDIMAFHFHPQGIESYAREWSDGYMEHLPLESVKYEPAVGRCRNCAHYTPHRDCVRDPDAPVCKHDDGFCDEFTERV